MRKMNSNEEKTQNTDEIISEARKESFQFLSLAEKFQKRIHEKLEGTLSPEASSNKLTAEVERLKKTAFTIEEFHNTELVNGLILRIGYSTIKDEAEYRYDKWLRKRGKDLPTVGQVRMASYQLLLVTLESCLRELRNYLHNDFGTILLANAFVRRLAKILTANAKDRWIKLIEAENQAWQIRHNLKEDDLKVWSHLTAKLLVKISS
jgi:hypothetical protein